VQFSKNWTELLKSCRGLVIDKNKIVARCMPKFWNDFEHKNNPEILGKIPTNVKFTLLSIFFPFKLLKTY